MAIYEKFSDGQLDIYVAWVTVGGNSSVTSENSAPTREESTTELCGLYGQLEEDTPSLKTNCHWGRTGPYGMTGVLFTGDAALLRMKLIFSWGLPDSALLTYELNLP